MLSKFRRFEAGNYHKSISSLEFKLFESKLTDEQWDILDKMETKEKITLAAGLIVMLIYGLALGFFAGMQYAMSLIPVV